MAGEVRDVRHNVITISSITAFADVKGGIHDFCKDVYFIRALGTCSSLAEEIGRLEDGLSGKPKGSAAVYRRLRELPRMLLPDKVNACLESYQQWKDSQEVKMFTPSMIKQRDSRVQKGISAGQGVLTGTQEMTDEVLCGQDVMSLEAWAEMLGNGCRRMATLFAQNSQVNASQEKNFIVKMIYWLDWLGEGWIFLWDRKETVKIVAENVVKKQEYFFYYLLTLLGMDVLLLQSRQDIPEDLERLGLSEKFVLGAFGEAALLPFSAKTAVFLGENQNHNSASGSACADSANENGRIRVKLPERPGRRREVFSGSSAGVSRADAQVRPVPASNLHPPVSGGNLPVLNSSTSGTLSSGTVPTDSESGRRATVVLPPRSGRTPSSLNNQNRRPGGVRREMSFEELARLASSVVMITVHNPNGEPAGSGSGIMVGQGGYILTNHHVAAHGSFYSVSIEGEDKQYRTEDIIKYNSLYDLAVIRIDRKLHPLPVFKGNPPLVRGQKVVAIGSPLGLFNSVSDGIISGFRTIRDVDMIQFTAPISHGSSGGAVLNMFGEVIGISTAGIDDGQNINLAMGYEVINMFIQGFTL